MPYRGAINVSGRKPRGLRSTSMFREDRTTGRRVSGGRHRRKKSESAPVGNATAHLFRVFVTEDLGLFGVTIPSGVNIPNFTDGTNYGFAAQREFNIELLGSDPVNVSSIVISGVGAPEFSFALNDFPGAAPGQFQINFSQNIGTYVALVTINSDDPFGPYTFLIQGAGIE